MSFKKHKTQISKGYLLTPFLKKLAGEIVLLLRTQINLSTTKIPCSAHKCEADITFLIRPLPTFGCFFPGMGRVYYLFYLIFSISIYINQMHTQRYIILKKYTCFITLDIFQKYPYPKLSIFPNPSKSR